LARPAHVPEEDTVAADQTPQLPITLSNDGLDLVIDVDGAGIPRITRLSPATAAAAPGPPAVEAGRAGAGLPLADVILAGEGRAWSGRWYCESATTPRLRYGGHDHSMGPGPAGRSRAPSWRQLRVDLADPRTGLRAQVFYRLLADTGVLRSWVVLADRGTTALTVESVTSFLCGGLPGHGPDRPGASTWTR
jgi:alpha-galactosidase